MCEYKNLYEVARSFLAGHCHWDMQLNKLQV